MPKRNDRPLRDLRKQEAKERQAARDSRTADEQLALLDGRSAVATRERNRLWKQVIVPPVK